MSSENTSKRNAVEEMETITLPRKKELGKNQQEFYSVNGKNYLVKLGVPVQVPKALAELIRDNQAMEDAAFEYQSGLPEASSPEDEE